MCGIAGIWNLDGRPIDGRAVARFSAALAHRGPDGRGLHLDGEANLGLGHCRLAILDPAPRAAQPMASNDGGLVIVFNGEIYNFIELRRELETLGHTFCTDTDTEVILAAYAQWGEACFARFNGMWALALWDSRERTLLLCRDRFGVKPLHYLAEPGRFSFASELRAYQALEGYAAEPDPGNVALCISRPSMFEGTTHCLLKGVARLPGGYSLRVLADGTMRLRRWWNTLDHLEQPPTSYGEQVERFRELFLDACRLRLRSDVPLATSLSGGLDSSSVLAAVHALGSDASLERLPGDWQKAFVASYGGTSHDESAYARIMAGHLGVEALVFPVTPELLCDHAAEVIRDYGELCDIPVGPWLAYRRQRAEGVVVSLDGHGGDELLGGYHRYHHPLMTDALLGTGGMPGYETLKDSLLAMFEPGHPVHVPAPEQLLAKRTAAGGSALREVYPDGAARTAGHPWLRVTPTPPVLPQLEEDVARLAGHDSLFVHLYVDYHCMELPTNLRDYDRLSMAHGVEVRSPFCDWKLACYAFSLPSETKIGGGWTKRILRDAVRGLVPDAIRLRRTKVGFANPRAEWRQALRPLVMETVRGRAFRASPLWQGEEIATAVERGYAEGRHADVDRAWMFVQASLLLESLTANAACPACTTEGVP